MKRGVIVLMAMIIVVTIVAFYGFNSLNSGNETAVDNEELEDVWNEIIESALDPIDCVNVSPPNFGLTYNGALIDAHFHIANIPDNVGQDFKDEDEINPLLGVNTKITDIVCTLENEKTERVFAFFPVYKEIPIPMIQLVNKTMQRYPDKFIPFIMTPDNDDSPNGFPTVDAETLKEMLSIQPNLFEGYGEIGLYERGDHGGPKGSPELPPDSQRLKDIYPVVRDEGLVVYFHLGEGQKESFERALEENPDIDFIWHGDQLIPYEKGIQNLEEIEDILSKHPNAYYGVDELYGDVWLLRPEIKKEEFLAHFDNHEELLEKDIATWKGFIERHPDQVLWGTDRGWSAPWSMDEDVGITLSTYTRVFIAKLDPSVQEKFAYKNAEKLLN